MTLTVCYQCRGTVADNAPFCPHCGAPHASRHEARAYVNLFQSFRNLPSTRNNLPLFIGAIVGVLVVLGVLAVLHYFRHEIGIDSLWWQFALGALIGSLIGTFFRR
jgi:hypothetical protein